MAYDVSIKIAQRCQGGIRRILKVNTLCCHLQQKNAYISNFMVLLDYQYG